VVIVKKETNRNLEGQSGSNIRCSSVGLAPHPYSYVVITGGCWTIAVGIHKSAYTAPHDEFEILTPTVWGQGTPIAESKAIFMGSVIPKPVVCSGGARVSIQRA
jgi:hypothetical protein